MTAVTNPERAAAQRLAAARAHRPTVDANGKPVGPPAAFTYDDAGLLTGVEPATDDTTEGES